MTDVSQQLQQRLVEVESQLETKAGGDQLAALSTELSIQKKKIDNIVVAIENAVEHLQNVTTTDVSDVLEVPSKCCTTIHSGCVCLDITGGNEIARRKDQPLQERAARRDSWAYRTG